MSLSGRWSPVIQVLASAALLAFAVSVAKPANLVNALRDANTTWIAVSLLFIPVLIVSRVFRWHVLARTRKAEMSFRESAHSYMGGLALATITPFAAGELARGVFAAPDDKAGFVGLTVLDKMIDAFTLFLFACVGFVIVAAGWMKVAGLAAAACALGGLAAAQPLAAVFERRLPNSRLTNALRRALSAARNVPGRVLLVCCAVAAANLALYYLHLYLIMYAFSPAIRLQAVGLFPLITASRVIPSVGGIGVREFVASALFAGGRYEVSSAAAFEASLVQFVCVNVLPVVLWLLAAGGLKRSLTARREGKTWLKQ